MQLALRARAAKVQRHHLALQHFHYHAQQQALQAWRAWGLLKRDMHEQLAAAEQHRCTVLAVCCLHHWQEAVIDEQQLRKRLAKFAGMFILST